MLQYHVIISDMLPLTFVVAEEDSLVTEDTHVEIDFSHKGLNQWDSKKQTLANTQFGFGLFSVDSKRIDIQRVDETATYESDIAVKRECLKSLTMSAEDQIRKYNNGNISVKDLVLYMLYRNIYRVYTTLKAQEK